tara:strand:- start:915 stop:1121 length:207 start_codon:yes stop_codon:yes gene_type:complete
MNKSYEIEIGLTSEDIENLLKNEMSTLHFLPTEETEYDERISVHIKKVDDDATLSECMNLVVDKLKQV